MWNDQSRTTPNAIKARHEKRMRFEQTTVKQREKYYLNVLDLHLTMSKEQCSVAANARTYTPTNTDVRE